MSDINDESEDLREILKKKISAYIGVPLNPISFTQIEKYFSGESLIVNNYPIKEITDLTIGDMRLSSDDYIVDSETGLIYFKKEYEGLLILKYTCCLSDEQISMYIEPLVNDMVEYELDTGWRKNAASIKEGDVQINIDTSIGKGALIQKNLDELKSMFNSYARMI